MHTDWEESKRDFYTNFEYFDDMKFKKPLSLFFSFLINFNIIII